MYQALELVLFGNWWKAITAHYGGIVNIIASLDTFGNVLK
jgi:hypothetical protein